MISLVYSVCIIYLVYSILSVQFTLYENTEKTLHLTLVLIKIANYVVRCTSYNVMTLIFNTKILMICIFY